MLLAVFISSADARYTAKATSVLADFNAKNSNGFALRFRFFSDVTFETKAEMLEFIATNSCDGAIVANYKLLKILVNKTAKDANTVGSGVTLNDYNLSFVEDEKILITNPLAHLVLVHHAIPCFKRGLSKFDKFSDFHAREDFTYNTRSDLPSLEQSVALFSECSHIAVDIETGLSTRIKSIAFAGYIPSLKHTLAVSWSMEHSDADVVDNVRAATAIVLGNNADKIFQNGLFDVYVLTHFGLLVRNWYWDTYGLFHAWLAELPRDLGFIAQFCMRDILYWKDESSTDLLQYNAKDAFATLKAFNYLITSMPAWAKTNYTISFPLVFPCLHANLTGVKVDQIERAKLANKFVASADADQRELNVMLGCKFFNASSPKQVASLIQTLAPKLNITTSDKFALDKFSYAHPLNTRIVDKIIAVRKAKKLYSSYITAPLYKGRMLYALNPFGTESGRMACTASAMYEKGGNSEDNNIYIRYGTNIQTIPPKFKTAICADDGYSLIEMDKSASETYCTAFLAGDEKLKNAVTTSDDFHSFNAELFFGIPAADVKAEAKVLKAKGEFSTRDLAKRLNHGANYNMGAFVLARTMGDKNMWKAKTLLKLPVKYTIPDIAKHLLSVFDAGYPKIRGEFQNVIRTTVAQTRALVSPSGWTRLFFGDIENKQVLNEAIAHGPQHLSVYLVNCGYLALWKKYGFDTRVNFLAQIHDSIFFQIRNDSLHLLDDIKSIYDATARISVRGELMQIPSTISDPQTHWK